MYNKQKHFSTLFVWNTVVALKLKGWTALPWAASRAKVWLKTESYSACIEVGTTSLTAQC